MDRLEDNYENHTLDNSMHSLDAVQQQADEPWLPSGRWAKRKEWKIPDLLISTK